MPPRKRGGRKRVVTTPFPSPSGRFYKAYRTSTGRLVIARGNARTGERYKRDSNRYFFDRQTRQFVSARHYVRIEEGWDSKEQKELANRYGFSTPEQARTLSPDPARAAQRHRSIFEDKWRDRQLRETGYRPGINETRRSPEFQELILRLDEVTERRAELKRMGLEGSASWNALMGPEGEYAQILILLGVRSPENFNPVGDSP